MRLLTYNLLTFDDARGRDRHPVARRVIRAADADVVALQEVTRSAEFDQAADLLGPDYTIVDLPGWSADHVGECLATRLPVRRVHTLDAPLAGDARAAAVAVEVATPLGRLVAVHHRGTYERDREHVREQQALATARFVEGLVGDDPSLAVALLGDFNADPDAASLRFLTGRQSLEGMGVRYEDAWEASRRGNPGHTFTPRNPLVRQGEMPLERGRRIDHILIRSGAHGPPLDVADVRLVGTEPHDGTYASDHYGVLAELRPPDHPPGTWQRDAERDA